MKYIKSGFFVVAFAIVFAAPAYALALETSDNGTTIDGSVVSAPATTQDNGTTAGSSSNGSGLQTQDNGTTAGSNTSGSGLQTEDNGTTAGTPSAPGTTDSGSTSGNTGGSSISSGSGYVSNGGVVYSTSCPVLTGYLKAGNTGAEVTKLQNFLKKEGINVAATGIYDAQTIVAVMAFQTKYAAQILAPWGISTPTGNVYLTTLKVINSRACNTALTLTPAELSLLNARKAAVERGITPAAEVVGTVTAPSTTGISGTVIAGSDDTSPVFASSSENTQTQTAAVGRVSILAKIWDFIKRIFGR